MAVSGQRDEFIIQGRKVEIRSLRLINYRCFKDSGEIPITHFSVFIGRNDGGKSSALLALYKLLGAQQFEDDDHRKESVNNGSEHTIADEMEIRIRLKDESGEDYHYRCFRRLNSTGVAIPVAYEIEQECVEDNNLNQDFESLQLEQLKELCGNYKLDVTGQKSKKATFITALNEHRAKLPKSKGWIPAQKAFRDRLPKPFQYAEGTEVDPQQIIRNSLNQYFRASILPEHRIVLEETRNAVQIRLNEEAIKYVDVLSEHCPEVTNVSADLDEASFENIQIGPVRVTQVGGAPVDWGRIGRGKRREMSLAVFRFHANLLTDTLERQQEQAIEERNVLALFDEPDLNLDYSAQRRMSVILQRLGEYAKCQVLVATHSINLIDNTPLDQICFFGRAQDDNTTAGFQCFDPGEDAELLDILHNSMGLRNSALFNEKLFLICEGETELVAFPLLYTHITGNSLYLHGIHIINGLSNEEALRIARILKKNKRPVHLVLDKDCCDRYTDDNLKKNYLVPNDEVTFIGNTEFEDSFDDDVWVAMLNRYYPRISRDDWTLDDLRDAHSSKKFSAYMLKQIGTNSKHVGKPQLGSHLIKTAVEMHCIPKELVSLVGHLQDRVKEL